MGNEYWVYGLAIHDDRLKMLIDRGYFGPRWVPVVFFEVIDSHQPADWEFQFFNVPSESPFERRTVQAVWGYHHLVANLGRHNLGLQEGFRADLRIFQLEAECRGQPVHPHLIERINRATEMKVGMDPRQLAINEACGKAFTEEQLKDAPKWQRDLYDFTQGLDKAIQPAVPLILIAAGGAAGAKGGGGKKPTVGIVEPSVVKPGGQGGPTRPFGQPSKVDDHFNRHGEGVGAVSPTDYVQKTSDFFNSRGTYLTKVDSTGTIRVFDPATGRFGSYNPDGTTKTYFKPDSPTYWDRQPGE